MGEDVPVELRPKHDFKIIRVDTGEVLDTVLDVQYTYAMEKVKEYLDLPELDGVAIDCVKFTTTTEGDE